MDLKIAWEKFNKNEPLTKEESDAIYDQLTAGPDLPYGHNNLSQEAYDKLTCLPSGKLVCT